MPTIISGRLKNLSLASASCPNNLYAQFGAFPHLEEGHQRPVGDQVMRLLGLGRVIRRHGQHQRDMVCDVQIGSLTYVLHRVNHITDIALDQ